MASANITSDKARSNVGMPSTKNTQKNKFSPSVSNSKIKLITGNSMKQSPGLKVKNYKTSSMNLKN